MWRNKFPSPVFIWIPDSSITHFEAFYSFNSLKERSENYESVKEAQAP